MQALCSPPSPFHESLLEFAKGFLAGFLCGCITFGPMVLAEVMR